MDIDSFAPRIGILVNCNMDFFEEVAKIRATRRLFARMMREEFGAKDPRSWSAVITCHTSGLSLTAQQPVNNIVRGTLQSLAVVMAGVQAVESSAFDEAYRTPSPESHMVGLTTQQIIQLESNVAKVVDPLGGSYFIESLTDEMEKRIWARVLEIEAMGDPEELSDKGWFKRYFEEAMAAYSQKISDGSLPKVGLNAFQIPEEQDTLLKEVVESKIEPCWSRIDEIKRFKESRDQARIKDVLLEEIAYDKSLRLEAEWHSVPPAVFPHKAHVQWLDCNNCHPDIFNIKKKTTKHFAMVRILAGEFCGVCHLRVAFPMNDCKRCHPSMKG